MNPTPQETTCSSPSRFLGSHITSADHPLNFGAAPAWFEVTGFDALYFGE